MVCKLLVSHSDPKNHPVQSLLYTIYTFIHRVMQVPAYMVLIIMVANNIHSVSDYCAIVALPYPQIKYEYFNKLCDVNNFMYFFQEKYSDLYI